MRGAVIPVFIFDRALLNHPETGVARVAFMIDALHALDNDLRDRSILQIGDRVWGIAGAIFDVVLDSV